MDNICHTLVGAACGEAGLKHRSRLANATLMIAANLPDLDVAVFATDTPSVAFRRGWTHGIVAQAVLPPLLAVVMWSIARRRSGSGPPPRLGWLVVLSYIGVFSHVGLDLLNNYGVRLLMPFSGRWFYGDTLFILDPWMWAVLGWGVWASRRSAMPRAARRALAVASLYVVLMIVGARAARQIVIEAWESTHGTAPQALMVGPRAATPFTRDIIIDAGDHYETGTFSWLSPSVTLEPGKQPKNDRDPAVSTARLDPGVRAFLVWSRFPRWTVERVPEGADVTVEDMRFGAARRLIGRGGFEAGTTVVDE